MLFKFRNKKFAVVINIPTRFIIALIVLLNAPIDQLPLVLELVAKLYS
ncbi:MAG: hypothetical protein ACJAS1_003679 [Oleiphilaceae bacterium]|jgi:hypothetical protein